jgi:hypothetical protein
VFWRESSRERRHYIRSYGFSPAFVVEYASARERWRHGIAAEFPAGTYWLQRFASVPVLET